MSKNRGNKSWTKRSLMGDLARKCSWSFLVLIGMIAMCYSTTATQAAAGDIYLGGTAIDSTVNSSGEGWTYTAETKTLLLDEYTYEGAGYTFNGTNCGIYIGVDDVHIDVKRKCYINLTSDKDNQRGIYVASSVHGTTYINTSVVDYFNANSGGTLYINVKQTGEMKGSLTGIESPESTLNMRGNYYVTLSGGAAHTGLLAKKVDLDSLNFHVELTDACVENIGVNATAQIVGNMASFYLNCINAQQNVGITTNYMSLVSGGGEIVVDYDMAELRYDEGIVDAVNYGICARTMQFDRSVFDIKVGKSDIPEAKECYGIFSETETPVTINDFCKMKIDAPDGAFNIAPTIPMQYIMDLKYGVDQEHFSHACTLDAKACAQNKYIDFEMCKEGSLTKAAQTFDKGVMQFVGNQAMMSHMNVYYVKLYKVTKTSSGLKYDFAKEYVLKRKQNVSYQPEFEEDFDIKEPQKIGEVGEPDYEREVISYDISADLEDGVAYAYKVWGKYYYMDKDWIAQPEEYSPLGPSYDITISNSAHGNVRIMPEETTTQHTLAGDTVIVSVAPDEGYSLVKLECKKGDQTTPLAVKNSMASFKMPSSDIELSAMFEKIPEPSTEVPTTQVPTTEKPSVELPTEGILQDLENKIINGTTPKDVVGSTVMPLGLKGKDGKRSITIQWKAIKDADEYVIYGAPCGKKMKKITTVKKGVTKWTAKKLKKGTYYKYTVIAIKKVNGLDKIISISKSVHVCTKEGKKGNPTKLTCKVPKKALKVGKNWKLKAKSVSKKKVSYHISKIRYESEDETVAKVSSKGVITAIKPGKTTIYLYGHNGILKKVRVSVK